jgi:hypothetical protein
MEDGGDLVQVNFSSPDHGIIKVTTSQKSTSVYDKIGELSALIEEGIRSVSSDARATIESDIMKMKREASRSGCPEVEYSIILFKRYAEDASTACSQLMTDNMVGPFIEVPTFLYEGTPEQLSGTESTSKNIFWMRAIAATLSFFCCIIMGLVTNISSISLDPNSVLEKDCPLKVTGGDFYYDSYKLVIAVSSFVFIHSAIFVTYYLLPVDLQGKKYVPGIDLYLERCFERHDVVSAVSSTAVFCKGHSKLIELCVDACLLILTVISCIVAAIQVDTATKFTMTEKIQPNVAIVEYYTIDTFFLSLAETSPNCVDIKYNPVGKIRGALFLLYLIFFVLIFTAQVIRICLKKLCNE